VARTPARALLAVSFLTSENLIKFFGKDTIFPIKNNHTFAVKFQHFLIKKPRLQ
jgi:hypothetical protein